MEHTEFVQAWKTGRLEIDVDRSQALRIAGSQTLPKRYQVAHTFWSWVWILSIPVAFAVMFFFAWWAGLLILVLVTPALSAATKKSAMQFMIDHAVDDAGFYQFAISQGVIHMREKGGVSATPTDPDDDMSDEELDRHILDANALVQSYAALLQVEGGATLRPETELPASKARIKSAILLIAGHHITCGSLTDEHRTLLRNAYSLLSTFVSEEAAGRQASILAAAKQWKQSPTRTKDELMAAARAISDSVQSGSSAPVEGLDAVTLALEFDACISQMT